MKNIPQSHHMAPCVELEINAEDIWSDNDP